MSEHSPLLDLPWRVSRQNDGSLIIDTSGTWYVAEIVDWGIGDEKAIAELIVNAMNERPANVQPDVARVVALGMEGLG